MDVSENSDTPISSILIGFSIINHPFWGTPIFGNTHIVSSTTNQEWGILHVKKNNSGLEVPMLLLGYGSWKIHGHEYPLNVFDASLWDRSEPQKTWRQAKRNMLQFANPSSTNSIEKCARQNRFIFPNFWGEKVQIYLSCHHPSFVKPPNWVFSMENPPFESMYFLLDFRWISSQPTLVYWRVTPLPFEHLTTVILPKNERSWQLEKQPWMKMYTPEN